MIMMAALAFLILFGSIMPVTVGHQVSASTLIHAVTLAISGTDISAAFENANGISFGTSADGNITASYTVPAGALPNFSAGTTSGNLGTVVFSNSNNMSFGLNGSTITGTASFAQSNQTVGGYVVGNTTGQSSSSSLDARTVSFDGAGGVSVGFSGGSVVISGPQTVAQTNQTVGIYAISNTTGASSSSTVDARSISFEGAGIASVGMTGGSVVISVPSGGGAGDGGVFAGVSNLGNTAGSTGTVSTGVFVLVGSGAVSLSQSTGAAGSAATVTISVPGPSTLSEFEPEIYGSSAGITWANGTAYFRPFFLDENFEVNRIAVLQFHSSQSNTTWSVSGSVSSQTSSGATGSWGRSATFGLFSRKNTAQTAADYSNIVSFRSGTISMSVGVSQAASWSTNASSATVSVSTTVAGGFISQIDTAGNITTTQSSSSASTSFSSTSTNQNSFSSSFANSFGSAMFSGVRPVFYPLATTILSPGDYWLMQIHSTNSGSTNNSRLDRFAAQMDGGAIAYQSSNQGYLVFGNTAAIGTSNLKFGVGSHSASSNSTTTMALTAITSLGSNASHYFMLQGQTL